MRKLFFLLKITVFGLILIFILQIKVGTSTLEQRVLRATRSGPFIEITANGVQKLISYTKTQYKYFSISIDSFLEKKMEDFQEKSRQSSEK